MGIEHTNRKGDKYLLQSKVTKTGKTSYYFGRKLTGVAVEAVPEGFEIYEEPERGQVLLRKAMPVLIQPQERDLVEEGMRRNTKIHSFRVAADHDSIIIYLPVSDGQGIAKAMERFGVFGSLAAAAVRTVQEHTQYQRMMRFTLCDEMSRMFQVERWCFRGAIDDWYPLSGGPLKTLVDRYVKHLGQESFYELL